MRALIANRSGATAIEYGLIAALVAVAIIASLIVVNQGLTTVFTTITTALARPAP